MEIRLVIDDRIVRAVRQVRVLASRRNVAALAVAAVIGTGVAAVAAPAVKPHTFAAGDPVVAAQLNENFDAVYDAFNAHVIREDRTLSISVEDGCQGLIDALSSLEEARIIPSATVTIEVAPGSYSCSAPIAIAHASGNRLRIVGTGATREDVVLNFPINGSGIVLEGGSVLGELENLTIDGGGGGSGAGISLNHASTLRLVRDVIVRDFSIGVVVRHGSTLLGINVDAVSNLTDGFQAIRASTIILEGAVATDNGRDGFVSQMASTMTLVGTVIAERNTQAGFFAMRGGVIEAQRPTANQNNNGVYVVERGIVLGFDPVLTNNAQYGTFVNDGGYVGYHGSITVSGNGTAATSLTPNSVSSTNGAVIVQ
jgi:hypothetical protein